MNNITLYNITGETVLLEDSSGLREFILIDEDFISVDTKGLGALLNEKNVTDRGYYLCFGGFYKLPGYGGGGECVFLNQDMLEQDIVKLPYDRANDLFTRIFQTI